MFVDSNGVGHNFTENYWQIYVFNNSKWEVEDPDKDVDNMTTWLNNTWYVTWINEGNFEMGFLAFMNKSGIDQDPNGKVYTPAQYWWMHYYYEGHEMLIGNLLSAWFGWEDHDGDKVPDDDEYLTPYFYMSLETQELDEDPWLSGNLSFSTSVMSIPLSRSESGPITTYSWGYNYSDLLFYVPRVNRTAGNNTFEWGFDYKDPGTYIDGSNTVGVQDFVYYKYTLVLNETSKLVTLNTDYISGDIKQLFQREEQGGAWTEGSKTNPDTWVPSDFLAATGNWAFIMAGVDEDYSLLDTSGSSINTSTTNVGLTEVGANVGGTNVFNYKFSQKPNYVVSENGNPTNTTTDAVVYEALNIKNNEPFINLVSGMTQLIGPFAQLVTTYAINQTNHFVNGIDFDTAWDAFDPKSTSALFLQGYPLFGAYKGGRINHDPVFTAPWTPGEGFGTKSSSGLSIPGYSYEFVATFVVLGVAVVTLKRARSKRAA
ncbi:MAG: hypothetical protein ACTSU5_04075 [Promethearchaeota archaeon]